MYAHVSEDIEMNLKNRNCGVRITIHQRFLFVQLQQCVIAVYNSNRSGIYYAYKSLGLLYHDAKDTSSLPLHHTNQANDLAKNLHGFRDDRLHGIVLRLEAVMSVLLIKTLDRG